jgi:serine/threonine protein kinase
LGSSLSNLPKKFGRYEVVRELGKGAMGVVYLGRDPVIGRLVALKTIRVAVEDDAEQKEFRERFLREAQAAGILSHPNIVTVHDVGEDPETKTSFIAMEYVEGKNLKELLKERASFTYLRTAEIIGQVAEALSYAHRRGIVHRDVKPANIIITPEGTVKITDFGIAKIEKSNLTSTGQFLGTPNYMSPEQVTAEAVDGRSDLFSLGVVLYELLTKKKPFLGDNLTSISYKIVHEAFTPPETYDASIPPEFYGVLKCALAKDPAQRYQRGSDFALALYEFKAREEERQMLRDLGDMVAEAEKLGSVSAVDSPPAAFPPHSSPSTPSGSFRALGPPPAPTTIAAPDGPAAVPTEPISPWEESRQERIAAQTAPPPVVEFSSPGAEVPPFTGISGSAPRPLLPGEDVFSDHHVQALEAETQLLPLPETPPPSPPAGPPAAVPVPLPIEPSESSTRILDASMLPGGELSTAASPQDFELDDMPEQRPTEILRDPMALAALGIPSKPKDAPAPVAQAPAASSAAVRTPPTGMAPPPPPPPPPAPVEATQPSAPRRGPVAAAPPRPTGAAAPPKGKGGLAVLVVGVVLAVVVGGVLLTRKPGQNAVPTPPPPAAKNTPIVDEKTKLMEDAKRFEAEGKLEESLASYREILRRDPSSREAADAASRLEVSVAAKGEQDKKTKEVDGRVAAARDAALAGDEPKVISEADAALAIDPQNAEASALKTSAQERLANAKKTSEEKKRLAEAAAKRKAKPTSPPRIVSAIPAPAPVKPVEPASPPTPTPATASLRIAFDSPISQGYVMVRLNDKEIFRKAFDFGKKKARGLVEGAVQVPSGRGELKVWVIASDRSVNQYKVLAATVPGGESRTLALELDGSKNLNVSLK